MNTILIIEDDKAIVDVLKMILEQDGFKIDIAFNGVTGLEKYNELRPDIVLLDIRMPKMDGIEVLQEIKKTDKESIVIMISGHGNIETAVQTTKLGAFDFIEKPFDVDRLKLTVQNGLKLKNLITENEMMKRLIDSDVTLLGSSDDIKKLKELISKVAATSSRVLVTGENGTGKEIVANAIHRESERSTGPFIHVNCATIPKDLLEVELFGCVEGFLSFTQQKRIGKFELASGGTLFLDEISDLNIEAQAKLLNVLTDNKIEPLGSTQSVPVDVRIISSTNRDLQELIDEGLLREDLYHRLNVININVPPLRSHKEDIPELVEVFSKEICKKNNLPEKKFTKAAIEYLKSMKWAGNVRELKNTIERLIILSDTELIEKQNIFNESDLYSSELEEVISSTESLRDFQDLSEKIFIEKKLEENNWNISKTAEALDIQRSHLYTKIKQFSIQIPEKQ